MTPLYSLWMASIVGALLFTAAGFFLARRLQIADRARPHRATSTDPHPFRAAAVDAEVPPRVPPPAVEPPPPTAAADPSDPSVALAGLRAQVVELRNSIRDARVREQSQGEMERDLLRLRADRSEMEQKVRRELGIELESARRRLAELEQVRDENALLRLQAAEAAAAGDKLASAEAELRDLRARGLASAPPPRLPRASEAPVRSGEPRPTAELLQALLSRLRGKHMRTIALADDLGLPIVGMGDDLSSLAAFAGYLNDIARRMRDFLPMGQLRRVTVEDENEGTVTACPLVAGDARIALVTLTVGPGPSARQMGDVLRSAASMVR